jgi:hypothetical protein
VQDDQFANTIDLREELRQKDIERWSTIRDRDARESVTGSVFTGNSHESELTEVARQSRLGGGDPALLQLLPKLFLGADVLRADEFENE